MIEFIIAFSIYAIALLSIGVYSYTRISSSSDFMFGGRGINYLVTALSAHSSDMSSWLFFGLPAAIYFGGIDKCGISIGLWLGMWGTWHFIAPRLRTDSEKYKSLTITHFLSHAAHAKGRLLIVISSLLLVFFFVFYLAAGLRSIGVIFEFAFNTSYTVGVITSALVVMAYTILGGYLAVALTDAMQAVFLLSMLMLVPLVTWYNLPAEKIATIIPSLTPAQNIFSLSMLGATLTSAIGWGFGYCGMPHVLTKFMSIDSVKNMKKAQYTGQAWQFLALSSATAIGLFAAAYFTTPPASGEHLFMRMVTEQFSPLLAGFVLCAILAATISTIDSQLIICATVITRDLYQPRNGVAQVRITRTVIALLTGIAILIAILNPQSVHQIVHYAWGGLGASFGPLVIMSLYGKRYLTPRGALIGMLTGGVCAAVWPLLGLPLAHEPLIPAFAIALTIMRFA